MVAAHRAVQEVITSVGSDYPLECIHTRLLLLSLPGVCVCVCKWSRAHNAGQLSRYVDVRARVRTAARYPMQLARVYNFTSLRGRGREQQRSPLDDKKRRRASPLMITPRRERERECVRIAINTRF